MSRFKSLFAVVLVVLMVPVRHAGAQVRYTRSAKLTASDPRHDAALGETIAASGDVVVLGEACGSFINGCRYEQTAYVYQKPASGWQDATQVAKLIPSDPSPGDAFGFYSVAIDGDTIVVTDPDKAYVYVKPASGWSEMTETAQLLLQDQVSYFTNVSIDGDTIVVGDPFATVNGVENAGAAFVFQKPGSGWKTTSAYTAELTSSNEQSMGVAWRVAVKQDTIVAGSQDDARAYVYQRPEGGWKTATETAILKRSLPDDESRFGSSMAIADNTIVIGDFGPRSPNGGEGVVDVFVRPSGGWVNSTETAELQAPQRDAVVDFGTSVAFDGNRIVVGIYAEGGRAFIYNKPASGGWHSTARADDSLEKWTTNDAYFAYAVAIANDAIIVGDPDSKVGGFGAAGSAFVFVPEP